MTEFLILQSLAQRPGIVKSRDALMDAAYDDQVYVDDRTIELGKSALARIGSGGPLQGAAGANRQIPRGATFDVG